MCSECEHTDAEDPLVVQQWLDQEDAWFRETMRRCGWAIQYVSSAPPVAYTVGLTGFDHPEIAIFGLGQSQAATALNALGELVRSGARLADGSEVPVLGVPIKLFDLPNPADVLFTANQIYGRLREESVPALQAIYPDNDHVWPWEPGCQLTPGLQPMPGQFRA